MSFTPEKLALISVTKEELVEWGLSSSEAGVVAAALREVRGDQVNRWTKISKQILKPQHAFEVHQRLYKLNYHGEELGPLWVPDETALQQANVTEFANAQGLSDYASLYEWSCSQRAEFWEAVCETIGIKFGQESADVLSGKAEQARWFEGSCLNITDSCFQAAPEKIAILESGESGGDRSISYGELEILVNRVANGLVEQGMMVGDRIGILMPMTIECVASYLGAIRAGCVPVSIAESFSAKEIELRLEIAEAKAIILADTIVRGGKRLACYEKFSATNSTAKAILVGREDVGAKGEYVPWSAFLSAQTQFIAVPSGPEGETNILFSSGTTGEPKAIPWTQLTPIKCAMDARFHQNVHSESIVAWPTSVGWMMGPWLIYAGLLNRATIALYDGAPHGREYCEFVQNAKVTMLGVIPSLVRAWRLRESIEGLDWSNIENFSSTGECSNAEDMHYLMSRAGYKPMVEYCGGTEIGGGYVAGTVVQPCLPACFTTPALGTHFLLLQDGKPSEQGEVFLVPPSVGLSTRLLNRDHFANYYADTPELPGLPRLRRHGDELRRLPNGYYQVCGRTDDAMNLGGIKVSAVEIETCLNQLPQVAESVAVAVASNEGGPAGLVVFVVPTRDANDSEELLSVLQRRLSEDLNPLFRIQQVVPIEQVPRTASNKILRRELRARLEESE